MAADADRLQQVDARLRAAEQELHRLREESTSKGLDVHDLRTEADLAKLDIRQYAELAHESVSRLDLVRLQLQLTDVIRALRDNVSEALQATARRA